MPILVAGLIVFFGLHSISIISHGARELAVARFGAGAYRAAHSILSVVGLALIVWGYGLAREAPVIVFDPPMFLRHLSALLLLPVFPLLLAAYLPGRIKAAVRHPMLAAVKIWAFSHLLVNGTLADLLLFGTFLVWAVADRISLKRRESTLPVPVIAGGPTNDVLAVVLGLLLYAVTAFYAHEWLIGVAPFA